MQDKDTAIWEPEKQTPGTTVTIPSSEEKLKVEVVREKKIAKTKQKYLNPATGKMVSYVRAKNLGLI